MIWLNGEVGTGAGDVAGGADYGPTDTTKGLLKEVEGDLTVAEAEYKTLMEKDVPPFNKTLTEKGIMPLAAGSNN